MESSLSLVGTVPGAIAVGALFTALGTISLIALVIFVLGHLLLPLVNEAFDAPTSGSQATAGANIPSILVWYSPAAGQLLSFPAVVTDSFKEIVSSFSGLTDIVRLVATALFGVLLVLYLVYHDVGYQAYRQAIACEPIVEQIRRGFLEIVNVLRFIAGSIIPASNLVQSFMWSITGVFYRVTIHCTIANLGNVFEILGNALANAFSAFFTGLSDFFASPDLTIARIDLVPFFQAVGELFSIAGLLLDCACSFLDFVWTDVLALPQSLSFAHALDAAVNVAVRAIQSIFIAINDQEAPQIKDVVHELQSFSVAAFDWIGEVVFAIVDILVNIVLLIPGVMAMNSSVMNSGLVRTSATTGQPSVADLVYYGRTLNLDAASSGGFVGAQAANLSDIIGLQWLVNLLKAPWPRTLSYSVNGVLALINGTWSLTLLITRAQLSMQDLQFFEVRSLVFFINWVEARTLRRACFSILGTTWSFCGCPGLNTVTGGHFASYIDGEFKRSFLSILRNRERFAFFLPAGVAPGSPIRPDFV